MSTNPCYNLIMVSLCPRFTHQHQINGTKMSQASIINAALYTMVLKLLVTSVTTSSSDMSATYFKICKSVLHVRSSIKYCQNGPVITLLLQKETSEQCSSDISYYIQWQLIWLQIPGCATTMPHHRYPYNNVIWSKYPIKGKICSENNPWTHSIVRGYIHQSKLQLWMLKH